MSEHFTGGRAAARASRLSRRAVLAGLTAAAGAAAFAARTGRAQNATAPVGDSTRLAGLGMELTPPQRAAGVAFLGRHPSVDTHCHPGRFILGHLPYQTPTTKAFGEPFTERVIADLNAGQVSAALWAAVADLPLLEATPQGLLHAGREFQPGEAYANYRRQLSELNALINDHDLGRGLNPADVDAARRRRRSAAIFAVEGGDFIEDQLDRLQEAFNDGVRAIAIVHYHVNQIGDIQTEAPVHQGLTAFGKSVIGEMNRTGIIVDLAHSTFAVTKDVLDASTKPVMISHTNLATPTLKHPRLISHEHAQLVAAAGGIIGSWPSGIGQTSFADYVDSIQRLVDAVGIEHVAIVTDMVVNVRPVFSNYRDWSLIPAALLARGMHEAEVASVMGGNFLRVFKASLTRR